MIIGATGMIKKNLTKILQTIPGNITTNKLQLEAVRGEVTILKRAHGTKSLRTRKLHNLGRES